MHNYQILTDSGADLPQEILQEMEIQQVPLTLLFRGRVLEDSISKDINAMYSGLRSGENVATAAITSEKWKRHIQHILETGQDVLVLTISGSLSTTYQAAVTAAQELMTEYPQRTIYVVDTRSVSLGQGLLVWHTSRMRQAGIDLEGLAIWTEEVRNNLCHWFTVEDLQYLHRGGRIDTLTAWFGSIPNKHPIFHMDETGHVAKVDKVNTRNDALNALSEKMKATALPGENDTVFICHGNCPEDAQTLAQLVKERCAVKNVFIGSAGSVIGSHTGPGALGLFFLGTER